VSRDHEAVTQATGMVRREHQALALAIGMGLGNTSRR
jgi:hypothetical protein